MTVGDRRNRIGRDVQAVDERWPCHRRHAVDLLLRRHQRKTARVVRDDAMLVKVEVVELDFQLFCDVGVDPVGRTEDERADRHRVRDPIETLDVGRGTIVNEHHLREPDVAIRHIATASLEGRAERMRQATRLIIIPFHRVDAEDEDGLRGSRYGLRDDEQKEQVREHLNVHCTPPSEIHDLRHHGGVMNPRGASCRWFHPVEEAEKRSE